MPVSPLNILIVALVPALYCTVAWRAASRAGERALLACWLGGATLLGALVIHNFRRAGGLQHVCPTTSLDWLVLYGAVVFPLVALGLTTLSVRKHRRRDPHVALTIADLGAGIGAFFTGLFLVLVPVMMLDIRASVR
jgi:hypothetical protein